MSEISLCQFYLFESPFTVCRAQPLLFCRPTSGVVSVSLSVVLGVEEDQSESSPAHARHEGGAHHPAFGADQVDQENDWRDHCMSEEQRLGGAIMQIKLTQAL